VLCLQSAGELAPRFEALGIPVDVLDRPWGEDSLRTLAAMRRYLRRHRPAILHTHNPTPHQYGSLARLAAGVPVLVHTKHGRNQLLSTKGRFFEKIAGRLTDAVVPVSKDAADVAREQEGVPARRIHVIHNGIDLSQVASRDGHVSGWRAVHVARLSEVKDQITLLKAARLVLDANPAFHLDIVGDGSMRAELEQLIVELGLAEAVTLHGFHDDVTAFLRQADVFVLSSVSEGIAITLLEAMAAALPVVATDVGGNREVVTMDQTGLLVPPANPIALAKGMIDVLSNPELGARFGAAGRERVARSFSLDSMLQGYERLYLDLLRRRYGQDVA
jgi:glycosyltransferase involved in cell wall biosynthesis